MVCHLLVVRQDSLPWEAQKSEGVFFLSGTTRGVGQGVEVGRWGES